MNGSVIMTLQVLNRMFAMATFIAGFKFKGVIIASKRRLNGVIKSEKMITVVILNKRLKCASFLESFSAEDIP